MVNWTTGDDESGECAAMTNWPVSAPCAIHKILVLPLLGSFGSRKAETTPGGGNQK
jgi:hypothetical protein